MTDTNQTSDDKHENLAVFIENCTADIAKEKWNTWIMVAAMLNFRTENMYVLDDQKSAFMLVPNATKYTNLSYDSDKTYHACITDDDFNCHSGRSKNSSTAIIAAIIRMKGFQSARKITRMEASR